MPFVILPGRNKTVASAFTGLHKQQKAEKAAPAEAPAVPVKQAKKPLAPAKKAAAKKSTKRKGK